MVYLLWTVLDLVYEKKTAKIIGFIQLGEINNILSKAESKCTKDTCVEHPPISDHI